MLNYLQMFFIQIFYTPGVSHFFLSLESRGGCKHFGKSGSSLWVCLLQAWLTMARHLAALTSAVVDVFAVQYMCLRMLLIQGRNFAKSLFLDMASSFFDRPKIVT